RYFSPTGEKHGACYLTGITTLIHDLLITDSPKRRRGDPKPRKPRVENPRKRAERVARDAYKRSIPFPRREMLQEQLTGFMRGSRIHRQIEDAVLLDVENFRRKHPEGMHYWAHQILQAILSHGWCPVVSEFVVFDLQLKAATRI